MIARNQSQNVVNGALVWLLAAGLGWPLTAGGMEIEEIVVTARKFDENIQDAPITVNAFTGDQLEGRGRWCRPPTSCS